MADNHSFFSRLFFCIGLAVAVAGPSLAQDAASSIRLIQEFKRFQDAYGKGAYSFKVRYRYATESKPEEYLDSLSGRIMIDSKKYISEIDSTVTVKNDRYVIILFKDDKLMYITQPAHQTSQSPMELLDSMFATVKGLRGEIKEIDGQKKAVSLLFPIGYPYKRACFVIDKSGCISNSILVIKTSILIPQVDGVAKKGEMDKDEYSIIEARYSDYSFLGRGLDEVNEQHFFVKKGTEYLPTEAYKEYKVFIASPNL